MAFKFLESGYSVLFTFITIRSNPSLVETMHIVVWEHFDILQKKNSLNTLSNSWMTSFSNKTFIFYLLGNNHYLFHQILIILVDINTKNDSFYLQWAYNSWRNNEVAHEECNFRPRWLYFGELAYDRPSQLSLSCLGNWAPPSPPISLVLLHQQWSRKQPNLQVLKMHFVQANPA